jgi:hypothetical protein
MRLLSLSGPGFARTQKYLVAGGNESRDAGRGRGRPVR